MVENYRPDVKRRLGIDYPAMREINPRLVYASISGFGEDGPYSDRPGFDQIAQGMGGFMSVTGLPGQGPVRAGIPIADLVRGIVVRARHSAGVSRAADVGPGPVGDHVASGRADFHAGFPGLAMAQCGRSSEAGRQQSSAVYSDGRVQDRRRPHQHRRQRAEDVGAIMSRDRGSRAFGRPEIYDRCAAI